MSTNKTRYTIKQRLFDYISFAVITFFLSYALACSLVGELIYFN